MIRRIVPGLLLLLSTLPALAQPTGAPPTALLDHLVGSWVLQGTIAGQQTTHDVDAEWVLRQGYVRLHEVSREKDPRGIPAYEAIVIIGWDAKTSEYMCLWLDSTEAGGLSNGGIARGKSTGDTIPFVFKLSSGDVFHNTFVYAPSTDSWAWNLDGEENGQLRPFARVKLTRK